MSVIHPETLKKFPFVLWSNYMFFHLSYHSPTFPSFLFFLLMCSIFFFHFMQRRSFGMAFSCNMPTNGEQGGRSFKCPAKLYVLFLLPVFLSLLSSAALITFCCTQNAALHILCHFLNCFSVWWRKKCFSLCVCVFLSVWMCNFGLHLNSCFCVVYIIHSLNCSWIYMYL